MRNGAILIGYKLIALLLIMVWNISMIKIDANRSKPDPVVCCLFLFFLRVCFIMRRRPEWRLSMNLEGGI